VLAVLEGVIARRVLLNFRADPAVVRPLVPAPLEAVERDGAAIVSVCLIRVAQLRPKGLPGFVGIASETMAHRVAVRCPTDEGPTEGVFVWQRHSDNALLSLLGGQALPGARHRARFHPVEDADGLWMEVRTEEGAADVLFHARPAAWAPTPAFPTFDDAAGFFARGDRGLACALDDGRLESVRLRSLDWETAPLAAADVRAAFYEDAARFPRGSVLFDGALVMRRVSHEWREITEVPELAPGR
jgi:hypothetical protein